MVKLVVFLYLSLVSSMFPTNLRWKKSPIPFDCYLHGRAAPIRNPRDYPILRLTRDMGVAKWHAGRRGEVWVIRPNGAKILDLEKASTQDTQELHESIRYALWLGTFPDVEATQEDKRAFDKTAYRILNHFRPTDVVNYSGAYGNCDWVAWICDTLNAEFVLLPYERAVALDTSKIALVQRIDPRDL